MKKKMAPSFYVVKKNSILDIKLQKRNSLKVGPLFIESHVYDVELTLIDSAMWR